MAVLVADAQPLVRDALRALLEARGFAVTGEAGDGVAALELAASARPELAVIDAALPRLSAVELLRRMRALQLRCGCVVTALPRSGSAVREVLEAGAWGVVDRSSGWSELMAALEAARAQRRYVAPAPQAELGAPMTNRRRASELASPLTQRQREVLALIAAGRSTGEIAERLSISSKTVETHRAKLMARVGVHKASSLVRYAIRQGLIEA
jgi:DNA-binding NarL/FixJ family response regulator